MWQQEVTAPLGSSTRVEHRREEESRRHPVLRGSRPEPWEARGYSLEIPTVPLSATITSNLLLCPKSFLPKGNGDANSKGVFVFNSSDNSIKPFQHFNLKKKSSALPSSLLWLNIHIYFHRESLKLKKKYAERCKHIDAHANPGKDWWCDVLGVPSPPS